jgi:hypothetical protein
MIPFRLRTELFAAAALIGALVLLAIAMSSASRAQIPSSPPPVVFVPAPDPLSPELRAAHDACENHVTSTRTGRRTSWEDGFEKCDDVQKQVEQAYRDARPVEESPAPRVGAPRREPGADAAAVRRYFGAR